jgi:hypothetical protein
VTVPHDYDRWRKSTRSGGQGDCVELHPAGELRDSKNASGPTLAVDLAALIAAVKSDRI